MALLTDTLRVGLANCMIVKTQAQSYHWNVRGMLFSQLHDFFADYYTAVDAMFDPLTEYIRIEGEMAPAGVAAIYLHRTITETNVVPGTAREMIEALVASNTQLISTLQNIFDAAEQANRVGLSDWASGQIDVLRKFDWQLKAHLEG